MISLRPGHLVIIVIFLAQLSACGKSPTELRLVTPTEPEDRSIVEEWSDLLNQEAKFRVRLIDKPLSEEAALDAIVSGAADIALVSNNLPFRDEITTVMPLYPTVLHIGHRGASNSSTSVELIQDSTVYAGPEGSASRFVFERMAERMGLGTDEYQYVDDSYEAPDIFIVFSPISPERISEIRELRDDFSDFQLLSTGSPQDIGQGKVIDSAVLLNPHFRPFVIPVGTYGELTQEPIVTIAVDKILVTRRDLDSAVVYDLINEILRLRPALAAKRPGLFQQLSEDFDTSRSKFIVHAGTQAYLQRSEPTVYERYSGIAEVAVTIIVAFGSAIFASVRIYTMRRKNRIDAFYTRTIALSRSADDTTDAAELQKIIEEVRGLQSTAFDLLVDEKLAADDSFRIFITLSNDVLRQLEDAGQQLRISDA